MKRLREISFEVLAELGSGGLLAAQVHESYMSFLRKATTWAPNGEHGFVSMWTVA